MNASLLTPRRVFAVWLIVLTAAVALAGAPQARAASATFTVQTVPHLAGVGIVLDGSTYRTGPDGSVSIFTYPGPHRVSVVPPRSLRPGTSITVGRWLDHVLTKRRNVTLLPGNNYQEVGLLIAHPVSLAVIDPSGRSLPVSGISSVSVTNSIGRRITFSSQELPKALIADKIVRRQKGLVSLPLRYRLQAVMMSGANVVHEGEQTFYVRRSSTWYVQALVFPLRIEVRDALFGFPIGHAVKITRPDGSVAVLDLKSGHAVTIPALPRGLYQLVPKGLGYGLDSPTALSRPQSAKVLLFSWVDISAVLGFAAFFLVGLPLLGGRLVRRRGSAVPAWHTGEAAEGVEGPRATEAAEDTRTTMRLPWVPSRRKS